jgi:aryl-alcohol dehydrogenase
MRIVAAVANGAGVPFAIESVELAAPQRDEVVVRIEATGLCHTDLSVCDGSIPVPKFPCVLGHEGAGIVVERGTHVTNVAEGDHVVISFSACGDCAPCQAGRPASCDRFFSLNFSGRRTDGTSTLYRGDEAINGCFLGQSSFATHALVRGRDVVPVPRDLPLHVLAPLGCGVQTGAGAVLNYLRPQPGASLVVFGAGAVGLSAVLAARIAQCSPIIIVDFNSNRLGLGTEFGATHALNASEGPVVKRIRELTTGGVRFAVEASGSPTAVASAIECCRGSGAVALLGAPDFRASVTVPMRALSTGATIRWVMEGDSVPQTFIPQLIDLYRSGAFPFDRMIRCYDLTQINQAAADCRSGATIKAVLSMAHMRA